jgi:HlyD family secretion protein
MTRRRAILLSTLVVALVAVGYGLWRWRSALFGAAPPDRITVSGNIEAHESVLSFTQVQASIVELPFDEGASVTRDTVLARVDDRLYQQQVMIDRAGEKVASAQVAVNESTLSAARSSVASDQFDLSEKQRGAGEERGDVGAGA